MYIHTYIHTYILCMYIYIYIYTHIYTHICRCAPNSFCEVLFTACFAGFAAMYLNWNEKATHGSFPIGLVSNWDFQSARSQRAGVEFSGP